MRVNANAVLRSWTLLSAAHMLLLTVMEYQEHNLRIGSKVGISQL